MSFLKHFLCLAKNTAYPSLLRLTTLGENSVKPKFIVCAHQNPAVRFKSRKAKSKQSQEDEEDSDDSDDERDVDLGKGVEIKKVVVGSMRADLLLKVGLGIARNKVEEAFYESRIRVNSKKIFKKSAHIQIGDEVDLIKGPSPSNPAFLAIGRLEILGAKARDDSEGIEVKMRRSKALTIENYPDGDPWKQSEQ